MPDTTVDNPENHNSCDCPGCSSESFDRTLMVPIHHVVRAIEFATNIPSVNYPAFPLVTDAEWLLKLMAGMAEEWNIACEETENEIHRPFDWSADHHRALVQFSTPEDKWDTLEMVLETYGYSDPDSELAGLLAEHAERPEDDTDDD